MHCGATLASGFSIHPNTMTVWLHPHVYTILWTPPTLMELPQLNIRDHSPCFWAIAASESDCNGLFSEEEYLLSAESAVVLNRIISDGIFIWLLVICDFPKCLPFLIIWLIIMMWGDDTSPHIYCQRCLLGKKMKKICNCNHMLQVRRIISQWRSSLPLICRVFSQDYSEVKLGCIDKTSWRHFANNAAI